jgi:hypothetical protein
MPNSNIDPLNSIINNRFSLPSININRLNILKIINNLLKLSSLCSVAVPTAIHIKTEFENDFIQINNENAQSLAIFNEIDKSAIHKNLIPYDIFFVLILSLNSIGIICINKFINDEIELRNRNNLDNPENLTQSSNTDVTEIQQIQNRNRPPIIQPTFSPVPLEISNDLRVPSRN